jgi:transposase
VAGRAEGPAAAQHACSTLYDYFDLWSLGWNTGTHPPRSLRGVQRAGRAQSQSLSRHCRQPEREKRRKRAAHDAHGYDAGKKIKGKKRHLLVDTLGLLLSAAVHSADTQDRDGAALVINKRTRALFPFILRIFADAGYQGSHAAKAAAKSGSWIIEIVKRTELHTFAVLPKRWIVERTIVWLNRCRRLAKDWENFNRKALAFLRLASIRLMLRKLCNPA